MANDAKCNRFFIAFGMLRPYRNALNFTEIETGNVPTVGRIAGFVYLNAVLGAAAMPW